MFLVDKKKEMEDIFQVECRLTLFYGRTSGIELLYQQNINACRALQLQITGSTAAAHFSFY
jgi:hypothetical protein